MTQSVDDKLFRCWQRGDTIREAILAVHRVTGVRLDFEAVRRAYVEWSNEHASAGAIERGRP